MTSSSKPKATEERLGEIRRTAAAGEPVAGSSQVAAQQSYYGLPVLKAPVWTWEIPLYFFLGGIAGVSSCIGFAAELFHRDPGVIRFCLWMALVGASLCPMLLIADLGRPARFLNMLRVVKIQSPMSVGAWVLFLFGGFAFLAVLGHELVVRGFNGLPFLGLQWTGEFLGALTGLLLASYTGVLIGATAVPVWSQNRTLLPIHFLTSGLGCSAGILELAGFLLPATQILGFVASGIETLLALLFEVRKRPVDAPLHHGKSGWTHRVAGLLEGPLALLLRLFFGSSPGGRQAAAASFIIGALLSRYAWIWAGRASAKDPHALFQLQEKQ
jgi:Polysulphide reductase, NrfD